MTEATGRQFEILTLVPDLDPRAISVKMMMRISALPYLSLPFDDELINNKK